MYLSPVVSKNVFISSILLISFYPCVWSNAEISVLNMNGQPNDFNACPFVYGARVPSAQDGLINCTWYSSNACCKRTEVTSVFSGMLPLDTPSTMDLSKAKHCRNLLNYMICYFCDPDQANWYNTSLKICEEFCVDVYSFCGEAAYNGKYIADQFSSGREFCEAQKFDVVSPSSGPCFKFDPTVFDGSPPLPHSALLLIGCLLLGMTVWCN